MKYTVDAWLAFLAGHGFHLDKSKVSVNISDIDEARRAKQSGAMNPTWLYI